MRKLFIIAVVGAVAQLIDGALGMGYGVTSSSLLLAMGTTAAIASATVHLGETGAGLASGVAHWRGGNVSWRVVGWIAAPGAVGAFVGARVLSGFDGAVMKPFTGTLLLLLGAYLLARFLVGFRLKPVAETSIRGGFLAPLGLVGGFVDAVGGGGWGPITTPTLLTFGRMEPRRAIGSANAAEFVVSLSASIGFLSALGMHGIEWAAVLCLLVGGVVVAPLAVYLVKRMPTQVMGAAVGAMLVVTNVRTLSKAAGVPSSTSTPLLLALGVLAIAAVTFVYRRERPGRLVTSIPVDAPVAVSLSPEG